MKRDKIMIIRMKKKEERDDVEEEDSFLLPLYLHARASDIKETADMYRGKEMTPIYITAAGHGARLSSGVKCCPGVENIRLGRGEGKRRKGWGENGKKGKQEGCGK